MRIKSYFASSVQSAIAIARKEYGDDVTLVTSHAAPLESRHLGDYEVVFAVDETPLLAELVKKPNNNASTQVIKAAAPVFTPEPAMALMPASAAVMTLEAEPAAELLTPAALPFEELLQEAIATPLSTEQDLPGKLERVHSILMEMGIDAPMVRALMTMIERSVSVPAGPVMVSYAPAQAEAVSEPVAAAVEVIEPEPAAPAVPDLTPAELAFYLSVSVGS